MSGIWILLIIAIIAANLPWLSERFLLFVKPRNNVKRIWMRLLEWLILYVIIGLVAKGFEKKMYGQTEEQGWEFYAVTFCLFIIFALPGFIYRHDLKKLLDRK